MKFSREMIPLSTMFLGAMFFLNCNFHCEAKDESLGETVAQLMKVPSDKIDLKKHKNGMSTAGNYSFEIDGTKYILKVFSEKQPEESRKIELGSMKILYELGLGSKCVAIAPDNSFYVRTFVSGNTLKTNDLNEDKNVITLAKALRKLHSYKTDLCAKSQLSRLEKHCENIEKKKVAVPSSFKKSVEQYKALYAKLKNKSGFCHNDLNPHNIILTDSGTIQFINLAKSGNGNIYEEIAYMTVLTGLSGDKLDLFLTTYFGRKPTTEELESVKLANKLFFLVSAVMYFDFSESKDDKNIDMKDRVQNLDNWLSSGKLTSIEDFVKDNKIVDIRSKDKQSVKEFALALYKAFLER